MDYNNKPFTDIIKGLVEQSGSRIELARVFAKMGAPVNVNTLGNWLRGSTPMKPEHILAVSDLTGLTAREVLESMLLKKKEEAA